MLLERLSDFSRVLKFEFFLLCRFFFWIIISCFAIVWCTVTRQDKKQKLFPVYIPYLLSVFSFIPIFHALTWPTSMTGMTTRWLVPTITVKLLYFSTLTWPTSITGVTTRWLVSNHFTRANWPDFTADRFLLSTLRLFKATSTKTKHSFSHYTHRQTFWLVSFIAHIKWSRFKKTSLLNSGEKRLSLFTRFSILNRPKVILVLEWQPLRISWTNPGDGSGRTTRSTFMDTSISWQMSDLGRSTKPLVL